MTVTPNLTFDTDTNKWLSTYDPWINVKDYGAVGDGTTDDTAACRAALAAGMAARQIVLFPKGTYRVTSSLTDVAVVNHLKVRGEGEDSIILTQIENNAVFVSNSGLAAKSSLSAIGGVGDRTITLVSTTGYVADGYVEIRSTEWAPDWGSVSGLSTIAKKGEVNRIRTVVDSTHLLLWSRLEDTYPVGTLINPCTMSVDWDIRDLTIQHTPGASGGNAAQRAFAINSIRHLYFENILSIGMDGSTINMSFCVDGTFNNIRGESHYASAVDSQTPYLVAASSGCSNLRFDQLSLRQGRHTFTTAVLTGLIEPAHMVISDSTAMETMLAGFDVHPGGRDITFDNCEVWGSDLQTSTVNQGYGFQLRGRRIRVQNCRARGVQYGAVFSSVEDGSVVDCAFGSCDVGIRISNSPGAKAERIVIRNPILRGIEVVRSASVVYGNIRLADIQIQGNPSGAAVDCSNYWVDSFQIERVSAPDATVKFLGVPNWIITNQQRQLVFDKLADVTSATIPQTSPQDTIQVLRRDTSSLAAPYIMRNAGLTDPGHALKAKLADNRWFEYAPQRVIDMTNIGASPSRTAAENTAFFNEAVAYSVLRGNVPIYWPAGTFLHDGVQQLNTAVPVIGAGQGQTILRSGNGSVNGTVHFQSTASFSTPLEGCTLANLTVDGNRLNRVGITSHGIRGQNLKRCLIRDVTVMDTPNYGIGFEAGNFVDILFDNVTVIRSGADSFDMKNNENGNRHVTYSNITIISPNVGLNVGEAALDVRSPATLSNIAIYGPLPLSINAIRFRVGVVDVVDDRPYAAEKSSLTNFYIYDTDPAATAVGVAVLGQNVNISNGNIIGTQTGIYVTGSAVNTNISNVSIRNPIVNGVIISGAETKLFGVQVLDSGNTGMIIDTGACGNHFYGCTAVGSTVRDLMHNAARTADLAVVTNITLSGEQTLDGVLTAGSRVAVVGQTNKAQNGVYITAAGAWTRATDADTVVELLTYTCKILSGIHQTGKWYRFWVEYEDWNATIGTVPIKAYLAGENKFFGGTFPVALLGSSQFYSVTGFRNEARGTATMAIGQTNLGVFHHMGVVPTQILVTPNGPLGAVSKWWVAASPSNQQFVITLDVAATVAINFAWEAYVT